MAKKRRRRSLGGEFRRCRYGSDPYLATLGKPLIVDGKVVKQCMEIATYRYPRMQLADPDIESDQYLNLMGHYACNLHRLPEDVRINYRSTT